MRFLICLVILSHVISCSPKETKDEKSSLNQIEINGMAQGTTYTIKYIAEEISNLKQEMDSLLDAVDYSMSTYKKESLISQLNQGDSVHLDSMFYAVFKESEEIYALTNGAFDPTIGPIIKAWGFDYADPTKLDSNKVDSLLAYCGFDKFNLKGLSLFKSVKEARLNFNAIAQGYTVDLMADLLAKYGVDNYYVELGGELIVSGLNERNELWRIGIDKPTHDNLQRELNHIVQLEDRAMATSGNYRTYIEMDGEKYAHSISPKSGYPVKDRLLSATIFADKCSAADAYATAFMVMGLEKSMDFLDSHKEIDAILIYSNEQNVIESFISPRVEERVEEL